MNVIQRSLLAALVGAVFTGTGLYLQRQHKMQETGRLRHDNMRLQQEIEVRVHARASAAQREGRGGTASPQTALPAKSAATMDIAMPHRSETDYRNEGNATPQATLQTIAWA